MLYGFLHHLEFTLVYLTLAHCSPVRLLFHTIGIKPLVNVWSALGNSCRISTCWVESLKALSELSLGKTEQELADLQECLLCGINGKLFSTPTLPTPPPPFTIPSSPSLLNPSRLSRPGLSSASSRKPCLIFFFFLAVFFYFLLGQNLFNVKLNIIGI